MSFSLAVDAKQYRQRRGPAHPVCDEARARRDGLRLAATNGALALRWTEPMEASMADRQQRSNREAKKPRKSDGTPAKPVTPISPPPTTLVIERGKKKNLGK
ncbi:MAG TPA: hypothetical protein VLU41_04825 [Ideonella sp.]|nr:hypothetical protein [Ideonella sp.]